MKKSFIKSLSLMLTMVLLFSTFSGLFSMTANAMDLSQKYEVSWDHTLTDEQGNTFTWYGGISASSNDFGHSYSNTSHTIHDYTVKRLGLTGSNTDWTYDVDYVYAFCVEPGVPLPNETEYTGSNSQNHGDKWERMSENQQKLIQLALAYGYPNRHVATSKDANACYAATQLIVWQCALNWRTSPTALNDKSYPMSGHSGTMTQQLTSNPYLKAFYDAILNDMANHYIIPSFARSIASMAQTYELTPSSGQYKVTLTDTNNVLSDYYVNNNGGLSVSISGNTLTITSNSPITSDVNIELRRRMSTTNFTTGFLIWSVPGKEGANQDMVTGVDADPVPAFLKVKVSTGNLSILKTTQHNNGSVSGFAFEVRNSSNTLIGTYTTDSTGKIDIPNLQPGTYSVKEINLSSDFVEPVPNPKNVEVKAGQTASVSFDNIKKRGVITVVKTDANPTLGGYSLAGAVFEVRDAGNNLVDTITTNSSGRAQTKILALGVYRVKEVTAPYGFQLDPETYSVPLSGTQGNGEVVYAPDTSIAEQPEVGRINIQKSNKNKMMGDYNLSGAKYEVRAAEDIKRADGSFYAHKGDLMDTLITDSQGKAQSKDLHLGKFEVNEVSSPYGYILDGKKYPVTLSYGGQTVPVVYETVHSGEEPAHGIIRIHKYNKTPDMGDYPLNGAVFEVRAAQDIKCLDGTVIYNKGDLADTITTNAAGEAQTKELPLGSYSVREKTSPYGFVLNTLEYNPVLSYKDQNTAVTYTDVTVPEEPQTGTITITKLDKVTGTRAQGDSTLKGAVYEVYAAADIKKLDGSYIYKKDQLADILYCGNNNFATSKELPLGNYYYKEKVPPVGYTLDTSSYPFTIEYQGQNVSVVKKYGDLKNKVIEGQIAITKHTDDPDPDVDPPNPQIEAPLEGAVFNVWLKSSGSYDNALPTERDQIVTDENGYAKTKLLPYGIYTVSEQPNENDVKLVEPFDVFISNDGKVYRYILDDPWFRSLVKIIKVDAETGKTVPAAGVSFKVKDLSTGQWVVQHINYPTPVDIDVFETSPDGTLVMPESLKSGNYELYEQEAPWGYVLSKTPVKFTVHSTQENQEIIEVVMANNPAKGVIKIEKVGNMLTGVTVTDTAFGKQYNPIFSLTGLKGAIFNVVAAEDIITPDGTLRAAKGTVVDTITTDSAGIAETKQLYLGNYVLVETKAPEGFVIDDTPHPVSLVYEGQEVAVVSSQIGIGNTRQLVEIELQKLMEKPIDAPDDFSAFQDVVFGLYSDEDIKAVDGTTVIAKDSLIALIQIDENGKGVVSGELPFAKYYVRELQTNAYYQLNETKYPVVAAYAGQDVVTSKVQVNNGDLALPNELKLGQITIEKTGEMLVGAVERKNKDENLYQPAYEIVGLPGAKFDVVTAEDIYDVYGRLLHKKGTIVDSIVTDADGTATTKLLHLGRYMLIETEAPYGSIKNEKPYAVTLGFDGEISNIITKTVSIFNERQKANILLDKRCEIPDGAAADFNPYSSILFELRAKEDVIASDGSVAIAAGSLLEYITFEKDGSANIKTDLPFGSFYVKEILTGPGYVLDQNEYDIVFDYDATGPALVTLAVNNSVSIENRLQRGSLKVIKTFENKDRDTPIAGVPFTITGTTLVGTQVTIEALTDENGEILLENLLAGNYTVTELESDLTVGYVLSPAENTVVAADEIALMKIENKLQRGDLRIIKTFEGRETPVKGVKFTIKGTSLTGIPFEGTFETDENGMIEITGLPVGEYTVLEIGSALTAGYILSAEQTAIIAADEITQMEIHNEMIKGKIKVFKTDGKTKTPLEGVIFTITDEDGRIIEEITTDEYGYAMTMDLAYGKYRIFEKSTLQGYVLDETVYEIEISEHQKVYELRLENNRVPENPETPPKTGDTSNMILWIAVMAGSAAALTGTLLFKKRRTGKKEA